MIDAAEALIVAEDEELILQDRSAGCRAELILVERQRAVERPEESGGVQNRVAVVFPERAVQLVGAALDGYVDDGSGSVIVLGAVVVGLDFELLDGVGARLHYLVREALVAGAVGVVIDAIEHEVVEFAALAVDVIGSVAAGVCTVFEERLGDARNQQRKIGVGAPIQREVGDFTGVDNLAAGAVVGFEEAGGIADTVTESGEQRRFPSLMSTRWRASTARSKELGVSQLV